METGTEEVMGMKKVTIYMSDRTHGEMQSECARQQRTISWIFERSWRVSRAEIRNFPSIVELDDESGSPLRQ